MITVRHRYEPKADHIYVFWYRTLIDNFHDADKSKHFFNTLKKSPIRFILPSYAIDFDMRPFVYEGKQPSLIALLSSDELLLEPDDCLKFKLSFPNIMLYSELYEWIKRIEKDDYEKSYSRQPPSYPFK